MYIDTAAVRRFEIILNVPVCLSISEGKAVCVCVSLWAFHVHRSTEQAATKKGSLKKSGWDFRKHKKKVPQGLGCDESHSNLYVLGR